MNKELPFKLCNGHKPKTKYQWKKLGMKFTEDEFKTWYEQYIYASNCNICNEKFKSKRDRNLDHDHDTGKIRDIICRSCNNKRYDNKLKKTNTTGYRNIHYEKKYKRYVFAIKPSPNQNPKYIKSCVNLDSLVKFAEEWYKENNYYT